MGKGTFTIALEAEMSPFTMFDLEEQDMQKRWKKSLSYILVFLVPWILIVVHSIVRGSWLSGDGSILSGDAGNVYYQMYVELWEKIHQKGSLIFTWNAGLGTDFLVDLFGYMLSPFTLIVLLFPKSMISNVLQFSIVVKWSLAAVAMLYYLLHSKFNSLKERKAIVSIALSLAYCLSNVMISGLAHVVWLDVMVVFPFLLLLEEKMLEGKGYKRFLVLLFLCMVCNFQTAIPMLVFLSVWYGMLYSMQDKKDKSCIVRYVYCVLAAVAASLVIVIPCVMAAKGNSHLPLSNIGEYFSVVKMPPVDFIQRFFVFDSLLVAQASEPMLYCGVVTVAVAVMYVFVPVNKKEKTISIILAVLLCAGIILGGVDIVWLAGVGNIGIGNGYAFLLVFLLIFMTLKVLIHLEGIRKWQSAIAAIVCVGAVILGFLKAKVLLDFYVYLASVLLCVLMLLLIFFFCRKSIQYKNILIVFVVLCLGELLPNAFYQLEEYNMYPVENSHYHAQSEVLMRLIDLKEGQRVANAQVMPNYGMVLNLPMLSGELKNTDNCVQRLYEKLGMAVTDDMYYYFGGSPLLNMMFNVKYGLAQDGQAYSDMQEIGENNGYILYEMNQMSSIGYMANSDVLQWNLDTDSPFLIQNDYVKQAAGEDGIFEIIMPDVTCTSVMGINPDDKEAVHIHSDDEDEHEHDAFHGKYHEEDQKYHYTYYKMYDGDAVKLQFISDGITDYYIFVDSEAEAYFEINYGTEKVYVDEIGSRQKTFHIGVVKEGTEITIESYAKTDLDTIDDFGILQITYQFAAFHEECYQKAYSKWSKGLYGIVDMTDTIVKGNITAEESGVMVTSIPALEGFTAYVDGKRTDYEKIGDALIGVPLEKGEHVVEFVYVVPHLKTGLIGTVIGFLAMACYCVWEYGHKHKM